MYAATLLLLMSMPLVLASPWSFVIMLIYIPIIALRICKEEQVFVICDLRFVIFYLLFLMVFMLEDIILYISVTSAISSSNFSFGMS